MHWTVSNGRLMDYRRPSPQEAQDCLDTNAQMILEKLWKKDALKAEDKVDADRARLQTSVQNALEYRGRHLMDAQKLEMVEHNKKLAKEKAAKDLIERRTYRSYDLPTPR